MTGKDKVYSPMYIGYVIMIKYTRQVLAASWGEPEVQQWNNARIDGLYNTNCIALCSKDNF